MVIRRRYKHRRREEKGVIKHLRKNEQITVPTVMLIDAQGVIFPDMPTVDALRKAVDAEMDLVEVSPKAVPPVVKIMDYGKYVYQQEKAERKHRAKQKKVETKGIRLTLKMADHDFGVRVKQANAFLMKGDKVKIELNLRGRERAHQDLAFENIDRFKKSIEHAFVVEEDIKREGSRLTTILTPTKQ